MQIGKLTLMLGIAGVLLIAGACRYDLNAAGDLRWIGPEAQSSQVCLLNERPIPRRNWPGGRILLKKELPWMPVSMKVLIKELGNG